jgi:hypothetical protein
LKPLRFTAGRSTRLKRSCAKAGTRLQAGTTK